MHQSFQRAMDLTKVLISAAIEVHRDKGTRAFRIIYEWCLEKELELRTLSFVSQKAIGLLLNFNEIKLVDGVHRLILPGANR